MLCFKGCKRVIEQQRQELEFLRDFVRSARAVYREPTIPATDLSLKPTEAPPVIPPDPDELSSFYADRTVKPESDE